MTLIADADLYDPVIRALKEVRYPILRYDEIGAPIRPDSGLMARVLEFGARVLVTRDTGVPLQAYAFEYAHNGLTVVLMRWKNAQPEAWQEMVASILVHGREWERIANTDPSVITVNRRGYRSRSWSSVPGSLGEPATQSLAPGEHPPTGPA